MYAYVFNTAARSVAVEQDIPFSDNGFMTAGITHAAGTAPIILARPPGNYLVTFSVSGTEANQFTLFRNGAAVPGATYGSGAGTQQNSGQVIVTTTTASDVLTLRNHTSASAVTLAEAPPIGGTALAVNASIFIEALPDP